jgi:hypothetical protein
MSPRRKLWVAVLLAAGTIVLWWLGRPTPPAPAPSGGVPSADRAADLTVPASSTGSTVASADRRGSGPTASGDASRAGRTEAEVAGAGRLDTPEARLAERLNHPDHSLQEDVAVVGSMVAAFRSVFRGNGNPVGDNHDITAALSGRNPTQWVFLRPDHPAIGADGQLRDRFGTPFHFHAESGTRMEVRSAGPDGRLYTPDDVTMMP